MVYQNIANIITKVLIKKSRNKISGTVTNDNDKKYLKKDIYHQKKDWKLLTI